MTAFSSKTLEMVEFAAGLIRKARHVVVLTGAGFSTPSGIPDFRSEGKGLWSRDQPMEVASLATFRAHPERFYEWFRPLAGQIVSAKPNAAHYALAELERRGRLHAILTQNIDLLHEKAGSHAIVELHGSLSTFSCTGCFKQFGSTDYISAFAEHGDLPYCPVCGSMLKPDVILFGEELPYKAWFDAQRQALACDLMIVAGSSLEVLPVAGLPMRAIEHGAHLIIINQSPTYLDVRADITMSDDVVRLIPVIVEQVLNG